VFWGDFDARLFLIVLFFKIRSNFSSCILNGAENPCKTKENAKGNPLRFS
jgi:hypothetical protein